MLRMFSALFSIIFLFQIYDFGLLNLLVAQISTSENQEKLFSFLVFN